VSRRTGVVVSFLTAAVVFTVGQILMPSEVVTAPAEPVALPPPPPPAAPRPPPAQPAQPPPPPPTAELPTPAPAVPDPAPAPAPARAAEPAYPPPLPAKKEAKPAEGERGSDAEIARLAWSRNRPDISATETHSSILVPIKGSIENASQQITSKPTGLTITLPQAQPLIPVRFYSVKREGFRNLWVKTDEGGGTTLRIGLADANNPEVEIKEGYVKVTVRKPAAP
jgi:hypothetical protein